NMLNNGFSDLSIAHIFNLMTIENANAAIFWGMGADADLDGARGVDQAFTCCSHHEGAVINALSIIKPCVLMGIELHQCQRTMLSDMRLQERPSDKVIAAQR